MRQHRSTRRVFSMLKPFCPATLAHKKGFEDRDARLNAGPTFHAFAKLGIIPCAARLTPADCAGTARS